jgi:uncharacterized membrane protein
MNRPVFSFVSLLMVLVLLTLSNTVDVPNPIAVHFDAANAPDGWTSDNIYRIVVLISLIGLPLLLVALLGWMPRSTSGKGQVPDHEYWFEEVRRKETYTFLLGHACRVASMTAAAIYVTHILILRANALNPPRLSSDRLIALMVIYVCGLAWWTAAYLRHFKK